MAELGGGSEAAESDRAGVVCLGCGYDLRGQALAGACPECGTPVMVSRAARQVMTKRELVVVLLRLLAVWLVVQAAAVVEILVWLGAMLLGVFPRPAAASGTEFLMIVATAPLVVRAVLGVGLWFGAGRIAQWTVKQDGPLGLGSGLTAPAAVRAGVTLMGIYFVASGAIGLGVNLAAGNPMAGAMPRFYEAGYGLVDATMRTIVGLLLILGALRADRWIGRLRTAGTGIDGDGERSG